MARYNPFFVMPGSALLDLREELELIEDKEAGETLERYGYRAGVGLIGVLDVAAENEAELPEMLPQIWSETGLGRMNLKKATRGEIVVEVEESIEAFHGRHCDFTRGYLAGIVSSLLDTRYSATEQECISDGKERCLHVLVPSQERMVEEKAVERKEQPEAEGLELGNSYLIESEDQHAGFDVYEDLLKQGVRGMSIVREYPDKLRKKFDLGAGPCIWLSYERDVKYAREPTNIPLIYSEIKGFLDGAEGCVVLISGLEYLISQNTFTKVLKFLQLLNENVAVKESILLLPLSTQALNPREVKILEREMKLYRA
ncbi:MAG TPA: DUF835 domain-containing protein [Methanomassiliicoccales archaeon]|jgi:predicted hydrocarbon binding protein|nr:DUF835 domain-containing protein [Methanomassiliicoccales archaeon]